MYFTSFGIRCPHPPFSRWKLHDFKLYCQLFIPECQTADFIMFSLSDCKSLLTPAVKLVVVMWVQSKYTHSAGVQRPMSHLLSIEIGSLTLISIKERHFYEYKDSHQVWLSVWVAAGCFPVFGRGFILCCSNSIF